LAEVPQFRGRKREIAERLLRGETPAEIVLAVSTKVGYVFNVASELRKRGILPRPERIAPAPEVRHPAVPNPEPPATPPALPIPITEVAPPPRVRAKMDEVTQLQQRLRTKKQEERLDAQIIETKLQTAIVHICPNPRDVFSNQMVYTQAISLILDAMSPYKERFLFYRNTYRDFGWMYHVHEKLEEFLHHRFFIKFSNGATPRSETPLKDEVESVLDSLGHPEEVDPALARLWLHTKTL
jgi:hypothetical protein